MKLSKFPSGKELLYSLLILAVATLIGLLFSYLGFTEANIITIYLLAILLASLVTTSRWCSLLNSLACVLIFNFLFTEPRFTLHAYEKGYPVTFAVMFIASWITGTLAVRVKEHGKKAAEAELLAQKEQLRANLLRSISHDLRTPLTSISGNASNLLSNSSSFDELTKKQIYSDIYDDSIWLINLVENLLSVSRMEDGKMILHLQAELMDEIITEALRHIDKRSSLHHIKVFHEDDMLLAKMDGRLIVQVIINLVDNAIKYTPEGTEISIYVKKEKEWIIVEVSDTGEGIPDEEKERVFEMFYTGGNPIADSRRSIGLGLFLCKSIIEAHGGEMKLYNNLPHGSVFCFSLPAGEVSLHE
ncbi:MAG: DUF4118 domain-containing protein [Agathobacter sp.]|nr:DUF4118 domain-containing protein [Agathobacter sp.]